MIPQSNIQELWTAARQAPSRDRVPYAFEQRVMSAIRANGGRDPVGWGAVGLWKAAFVCIVVAMMATGLDLVVQDPGGDASVEEALELAVLPVDDAELEL